MTTLTIPAREILPGDVLTIAGLPFTVAHSVTLGREHMVTVKGSSGRNADIYLAPELPVTVDRVDPDAELVEKVAEVIFAADCTNIEWGDYPDEERDTYRDMARAALAVIREAQS